jgi:Zn-dependent M28 family amino/carboxypeptidase
MANRLILIVIVLFIGLYGHAQDTIQQIRVSPQLVKKHVYALASDSLMGRETGTLGQRKAAIYCQTHLQQMGLLPLIDTDSGGLYAQQFYFDEAVVSGLYLSRQYQQKQYFLVEDESTPKKRAKNGHNVLAYLAGTDKKDEIVFISAHYDHLGRIGRSIFYGADDNGSGTAAVLAMAETFSKLAQQGTRPRRSIAFVFFSGEEQGLLGSKHFMNHLQPTFIDKIVCDLNVDMIGRVDGNHQKNQNYCYLIGSDFISNVLHQVSEETNRSTTQLELDYRYNNPHDPNRHYYRSDHYQFAKRNIPVIFYTDGEHPDYHKTTDTADRIDYDLLAQRTSLIFQTAWAIANREGKL